MGFFLRWAFAFLLVAATFNPTEWNYLRWASEHYSQDTQLSITVLLGLILLIGYVIYIRATLRSIGGFGVTLVLAVVGALLWVLYDLELLTLENTDILVWLGIFAISFVLFIGLSWSFVRRTLSGQYDVDDADE